MSGGPLSHIYKCTSITDSLREEDLKVGLILQVFFVGCAAVYFSTVQSRYCSEKAAVQQATTQVYMYGVVGIP